MSRKQQRIRGWIFLSSIFWIAILWLIASVFFYLLSVVWSSDSSSLVVSSVNQPSLLLFIKTVVNWILWMLSLLSIMVGIPLGIVWIIRWYRNGDYNAHVVLEAQESALQNIYADTSDLSSLSKSDHKNMQHHDLKKTLSPWWAVFFNIITWWLFGIFSYGLVCDHLPLIKRNDFWSGKAIWYMFIPFFNIYWTFVFRLRLTDRINLQYRLENKSAPISRSLVLTTLILDFVPYINYISLLVLHSIVVYKIQSAVNGLAHK